MLQVLVLENCLIQKMDSKSFQSGHAAWRACVVVSAVLWKTNVLLSYVKLKWPLLRLLSQ